MLTQQPRKQNTTNKYVCVSECVCVWYNMYSNKDKKTDCINQFSSFIGLHLKTGNDET